MPAREATRWRIQPIFISSTFKDMHAERDYLRHVVFLALEEKLRERHHHLEPIDLRLGVETVEQASEEEKELRVLKVCLDEIERSRPFLIVLLGDRYGWVPPADRMAAAAREAGFETEIAGKSVTALEIEFGILKKDPEQRRRVFFYFRDPLPYAEMPESLAAQYTDPRSADPETRAWPTKLQALKKKLQDDPELRSRIRPYSVHWDTRAGKVTRASLHAWGQQVLGDVWGELDEETRAFASLPDPAWEVQERDALEEFVEQRSRDFIGRGEVTATLLAHARSVERSGADWGLCVTGTPGLGKSALFAHLYRTLQQDGDVLLLSHAAGISSRATQVDSMLRRWIQELADQLWVRSPLPENASAEDVEQTFASLLGRAAVQRRVVVLIDAVNQFEPTVRSRYLTWLPKSWPPNARLIATAVDGVESKTLSARSGIRQEVLFPLGSADSHEIALVVSRRYHRELHPRVIDALLTKQVDGVQAAGNPLWLRLAMEELNLLDADDFARAEREYVGRPEERLHQMVLEAARALPPTIDDLYAWMLAGTERRYGEPWARAMASVIGVSRFGWRESDLRVLVPSVARLLFPDQALEAWDDLGLASLRRGFRAHLVRRGVAGQWDFVHTQMRQAVAEGNLRDPAIVRRIHSAAAEYLASLVPEDPLRQTERMVHLIGADDRPGAGRYYGAALLPAEEAGATQALGRHIIVGLAEDPNPGLAWVESMPEQEELSDEQVGTICNRFNFDLLAAIENEANLGTRLSLLRRTQDRLTRLAAADPTNAGWQRNLSASHINIGNVLVAQGDATGALAAYRAALVIAERLAATDPTNAGWQRDLSFSHSKIGNVLVAQGDATGALAAYRAALAIRERLAAADPTNAGWQGDLSASHSNIGNVLVAQGDATGALAADRAALAIAERLAAADPMNAGWQRELAVSHIKVGDVLVAQGDATRALAAYRACHAILERLAAADPTNAGWQRDLAVSHGNIGDVLVAQGDATGALAAYRAALAIAERLAAADPTNAGWQRDLSVTHIKIGDVLVAHGDATGALAAYRAAFAIAERLAAGDPTSAGWQGDLAVSHGKIGDVLVAQGDATGALAAYRAAFAIAERLAAADPTNARWQRDLAVSHGNIGDVLVAQGDATGALAAHRAAVAIRERLAAADPTNAGWQRNLSASHINIGDVLVAQGDATGALAAYRAAFAIAERLAPADPTNAGWQRDLAVSHGKIGDVLVAQGDATRALAAYRACHAILERLAAADPTNAGWQRDLAVSYLKLAQSSERIGIEGEVAVNLLRCREVLRGMRARGMHLDPATASILAQLDRMLRRGAAGDAERAPEVAPPSYHDATLADLRDVAERNYAKQNWDAAAACYDRLLARGEPVQSIGPRLVECLLKSQPNLPARTRARIAAVIEEIERAGDLSVGSSLRELLAATQPAPPPSRSRWKFWR